MIGGTIHASLDNIPVGLPARPLEAMFTLEVTVPKADIDALGHASNIAYVRWIQDAALAHSTAVGLDVEAYRDLGAVIVDRRHEIDDLRSVLAGERLVLRTWIDSVSAAKCKRATEIHRGTQLVASSVTTWGFVEIASGRPTRIPISVRTAFGVPAHVPFSAS